MHRVLLIGLCVILWATPPALSQRREGPIIAGDYPGLPRDRPPRLGVRLANWSEPDAPGVVVREVMPGYPAELAGMRNWDRIVRIADADTPDVETFRAELGRIGAGDRRAFIVVRDGQTHVLEVTMSPPTVEAPGTRPPTHPQLRDELMELREAEQALRRAVADRSLSPGRREQIARRLRDAEVENRVILRQIIRESGFPTISMVGEDGASAAARIAFQAEDDPALAREVLATIEKLAEKGEASRSDVALLTDRILRAEGRPQQYGSQYVATEPGEDGTPRYLPPVVEDPQNLDQRRRDMGLEPWAVYERRMAELHGRAPFERVRAPGE